MQFWSIDGELSYEAVRELQLKLVELRSKDLIPDTLLALEHRPVITRGRGLQFTGKPRPRHMPLLIPLPPNVEFAESERGGDLTYHGPGQWVMYPICKLDGKGFGPARDVTGFLRKLESVLLACLKHYSLEGSTHENATGVWIGEKKIASIGIAVRKWVTYHGIAINCVNDLKPFHLISPCGFSPDVMTRLCDQVALEQDWRSRWESLFLSELNEQVNVRHLSWDETCAIVESFQAHLIDVKAPSESLNHL